MTKPKKKISPNWTDIPPGKPGWWGWKEVPEDLPIAVEVYIGRNGHKYIWREGVRYDVKNVGGYFTILPLEIPE